MKLRALVSLASVFAAGAFAACGGDDSGSPENVTGTPTDAGADHATSTPDGGADDASDGAAPGDGGLTTTCDPSGEARALVVAVQTPGDQVRVLSQKGGTLTEGTTFSLDSPQRVAMRDDGTEAVVAWGRVDSASYGITRFTFGKDGSNPVMGKSVNVGSGRQPSGLAYVSPDRLVLTFDGPTFEVVTLDRNGDTFVETTRTAAPGHFPLKIVRRPGHPEVLLPRVEFGTDKVTYVHLMTAAADGKYATSGTVGEVGPPTIDLGVHANGDVAYSPASNPADPVTKDDLTTTGLLHVLAVGAGGITTTSKFKLPRYGSLMAVDPRGRFLVVPGNEYTLDTKNNVPNVASYALLTVPLDAAGQPGATFPESALFPALLFTDLVVSPSGHLVLSNDLYPSTVDAGDEYPLELRAQPTPGQWTVCTTVRLPGGAHVAFAP